MDYSKPNTECLTNSENISSDLDSVKPRLIIKDDESGWVNSDRIHFIDWLNNFYSGIEHQRFSENKATFDDAHTRNDIITNRLKPYFVKEHQHL